MAGMEKVVANVLWMRLIQFMGTRQDLSKSQRAQHIYESFDQITRLDPKFYMAYKYAVLSLFARSPQNALKLLDRGLKYLSPKQYDWQFPFYGAFICYRFSERDGRYDRALRYLEHAKQSDSAPAFVARFRPLIIEKNQGLGDALDTWVRMWERADDPMNRSVLRNHLKRVTEKILDSDVSSELQQRAASVLSRVQNRERKKRAR